MSKKYYDENYFAFYESTYLVDMSSIYARFLPLVKDGGLILDAGCGSGRDARYFKEVGYTVEAFDVSPQLASLASKHSGIPVAVKRFDQMTDTLRYDGIWCCASLLHVPRSQMLSNVNKLMKALKVNGCCYMSFKYGSTERKEGDRHFTDYNEILVEELLQEVNQVMVQDIWITEDQRPDRSIRWLNIIVRKRS